MILEVFLYDATERLNANAKTAINSMAEGDEHRLMMLGIKRFTKYKAVNTKEQRRAIAKALIDAGKYCF